MNQQVDRQHIAGSIGVVGGSLGALAGVVQATLGTHIPDWTGNKGSPTALGLLTTFLSGISLLCAIRLRRPGPLSPGQRVAAAGGLLVPGGLCFSTVGALWYLPGALLLLATAYAISSGELRQTRDVIATNWLRVLVSTLGAFELLMAVGAGPLMTPAVGVVGGLALITAPWVADVRLGVALLLIGTLPFAALTWWSLASPLLAILALTIGLTTRRHQRR